MAKVVNKRNQQYDVYIGRGSVWGNPFVMGKDGTREDVIEKFRMYAREKYISGEWTDDIILELYGKRLGCFCAPKPCHGDVLVEAVNKIKDK